MVLFECGAARSLHAALEEDLSRSQRVGQRGKAIDTAIERGLWCDVLPCVRTEFERTCDKCGAHAERPGRPEIIFVAGNHQDLIRPIT
jgi:hypothetical protein